MTMDQKRLVQLLSALADGFNPRTGEVFEKDSPYRDAEIVQALSTAVECCKKHYRPPKSSNIPRNAGKPWNQTEDTKLLRAFDRGATIADIASDFGRTQAGIQARLERHGRLSQR
jgi:hypothetical protein